jgi:nucleotide-binding universal stress UspA family protein
MGGTVIVGLDGSTSAGLALAWGWNFAQATGRRVRILHTWQGDAAEMYVPVADVRQQMSVAAREEADGWFAAVVSDDGSVPWRLEIVEGAAGPALVAAAADEEDCTLVVGTHEHQGLGRVLHGSVSHYVLAHADCPVVAVPPPRPERVTLYADPSEAKLAMPASPRF